MEADIEITQLLSRFPGVDFEKKEQEIGALVAYLKFFCFVFSYTLVFLDPYASTKGWVNRRNRISGEGGTAEPGSPERCHPADPFAVGYLYGSPSERFPLSSEQSSVSEMDEDGEEDEDNSEAEEEDRDYQLSDLSKNTPVI